MIRLTNNIAQFVFEKRYRRIEQLRAKPIENQKNTFRFLIHQLAQTKYGKQYGIRTNTDVSEYRKCIPVVQYEDLYPYIAEMIKGEAHVLWPGRVHWYAKSSGTTNDKSKYIPVPFANLKHNHIKGTKDTMNLIYKRKPDCGAFGAQSIILGGSLRKFDHSPKATAGDVSAIMTHHMPAVGRPFFGVDFKTALMSDWEQKINRIAEQTYNKDIRMIGGVPTWTVVLLEHLMKKHQVKDITEIWPNLEVYIHGGVGFAPYREQFKSYIPKDDFLYHEVYNASEGYIASQDDHEPSSMLLFTDNHMYFEFLPMSEWESPNPRTLTLEEVEVDQTYGLVLSSSSGLWRYNIGDTVQFRSKNPYLINVVGRTKQHINVFGEELMVANTDQAIEEISAKHQIRIREYTVAPIFMTEAGKGGHEWLIEFDKTPNNLEQFAQDLDRKLQQINTDYEAKRYRNMALQELKVRTVPEGTFVSWLKSKGKYGGQHKVPRLSNDRCILESLIAFQRLTKVS